MVKKKGRRAKLNWIVIMLVSAVVAFGVLGTIEEKYGFGPTLPKLRMPSLSFIYDFIEELALDNDSEPHMDNALAVSARPEGAKNGLTVHMLDMGQADSILIQAPMLNVLIDAGENGQGAQVARYLKEQGVGKIDLLIGTHPHSDHIGGMDEVLGRVKVGEIMLPEIPEEIVPTTGTYLDLLDAIEEAGLGITVAEPGLTFDLGGGAALTVIGPQAKYGDLNNMSVVCRITYRETAFLFTGDTCEQAEKAMVQSADLRADVMQIPHHGSNTSSSELFLDAVSPRIALISCGTDNPYGHPHRETLERLQAREIDVYRTDLFGPLVVYSDGERVYISTER